MKKIFSLLFVIIIFLTLTSCKGTSPFAYPMTKWTGGNFELYVLEEQAILACKSEGKTVLYEADMYYGYDMNVYEYRERPDHVTRRVATYGLYGLDPEDRSSYTLDLLIDKTQSDILPKFIKLKRVEEDLSYDDIPYEYICGNPRYQPNTTWKSGYDTVLNILSDNKSGVLRCGNKYYDVIFDDEQKMILTECSDSSTQANQSSIVYSLHYVTSYRFDVKREDANVQDSDLLLEEMSFKLAGSDFGEKIE